jgi:uncharacterized protein YdhG (YjbR/CyaY superfamily)
MRLVTSIKDVDTYIDAFPTETKALLIQLRNTIRASAPEAAEVISYGMPGYKWNGMLVYFAGYKSHIGFYPGASGITAFRNDLKAYKLAKGTVQFPLDKSLPMPLIKRMVKFRLAENLIKLKAKTRKKK